ncbi:hypothetical protein [Vibrio sp. HN007]|uniref:hypothetical protein n=1 Tax=Vibrio iocasae TaxID=3098914 RepID=UPI0035D4CFB7
MAHPLLENLRKLAFMRPVPGENLDMGDNQMWIKDWLDTAVVVVWIAAWSALVYFVPLAGI